jgi:hypothetical protein
MEVRISFEQIAAVQDCAGSLQKANKKERQVSGRNAF